MKTLLFRNTAWFLILSFCLTQIMPAGWAAAKPAEELQARSVPASVAVLEKPETPTLAPAPQRIVGFVDSTAFQLGGSPLSVTVKDPEPSLTPDRIVPDHVINPIIINPPVRPPLPPMPVVPPVTIVTDPATGREISVTINERGIATVRWGDQEYRGFFDTRTNSVTLVTNDDAIWTLQFGKKEDGSLYLQSFQTRQWTKLGYFEETYAFNQLGQLTRKDWLTENSGYFGPIYYAQKCGSEKGGCFNPGPIYPYRSGGTIDYVTINGKTLVSHEKTWSENYGRKYQYTDNDLIVLNANSLMPYPSGRSETESWYSYDGQGNLLAKNWNTSDSYGGNTFGQEQYVHINGRDLVSVRRIWQYSQRDYFFDHIMKIIDDPIRLGDRPVIEGSANAYLEEMEGKDRITTAYFRYASYHADTYYDYDSEGNVIAEVNVWEGFDHNGERHTGASYSVYNTKIGTWESASAEGIEIWQIRSVHDYGIIAAVAERKTVYIGGGVNRWNYTHRVEYTRNADGTMTAKAVYDNAGNVSIVVGQPDVLSGEADDIKFQNGQEVNGYHVYFQEYGHQDASGNWVNEGYRLIFYDSNWNATAVDFPAQKTITLDGAEYRIKIDIDGKLYLSGKYHLEIQAYLNYLRTLFQSPRYSIDTEIIRIACKEMPCLSQYQITVLDTEKSLKPGELRELVLQMRAGFKEMPTIVSAQFDGIGKVDAKLLYAGLGQLSDKPVELFTKIRVTGVDIEGISFDLLQKPEAHYRVYRAADGTVVLEKINPIPPAIQTFVNTLKEMLKGYRVNWELKDGKYLISVVEENSIHADIRLLNLSFAVSAEGVVDSATVRATYGNSACDGEKCLQFATKTYEVDGERLLGVVSSLEASFHPVGALWMSAPPYYYARLVSLMAQIIVKESDENLLRFDLEGKSYKAYWDAEGNMKLEQELPPAVQAYVDHLQAAMSWPYKVSATYVLGSVPSQYRIGMGWSPCDDSGTCATIALLEGKLMGVSFTVAEDGTANFETLEATYHAVSPNALLLFEAMTPLLASLHSANTEWMTSPADMQRAYLLLLTEISVTAVDTNGTIHFTNDGKNYMAYRDSDGIVKLIEEDLITCLNSGLGSGCFPPTIVPTNYQDTNKQSHGMSPATTEEESRSTTSGLADLPALRFQNLASYTSLLNRSQGQTASRFVAGPSMTSGAEASSLFLQQTTSLKSSPVFGFEQGSLLFGNILTELTR